METLVANFAGKVRREKLHGRDYLVAPVTILVPGVLNGSQGPLYYPVEECQANPSAWNGMPLVLNHPQRGSARIPSYIDTNGLGTLFNVDFVTDRLKGEAWFDIEKANKVDDRLVNLIERGEKIELSTGLGVNNEQGEGIYKNRNYVGVARDFKPDHLAILLDERGACSLNDGCGVNNKEADVTTNAEGKGAWKTIRGAKVFIEDGVITRGPKALRGKRQVEVDHPGYRPPSKEKPTSPAEDSAFGDAIDKELAGADLYDYMKERGLLPEGMNETHAYEYSGLVHRRLMRDKYKSMKGKKFQDIATKYAEELSRHLGSYQISKQAKDAYKTKFGGVNNKEADVTTNTEKGVWRTIRGTKVFIDEAGVVVKGPSALRGKTQKDMVEAHDQMTGEKEGTSDLKQAIEKEAKSNMEFLGAEIPKGKSVSMTAATEIIFGSSGRGNSTAKNKLRALAKFGYLSIQKKGNSEQISVTDKGYEAYEQAVKESEEYYKKPNITNSQSPLSTLEKPMCKQVLIDQLVENSDGLWSEEDREHLDAFSEAKLEALVANCEMNSGSMDEDEDSEGEAAVAKSKGKKGTTSVANTTPAKTSLKLADLPEEIQEVFNYGKKAMAERKKALVDRLVANLEGEEKAAEEKDLMAQPVKNLERLTKYLPAQVTNAEDEFGLDFFGAGAGSAPVHNSAKGPTPMSDFNYDFSK